MHRLVFIAFLICLPVAFSALGADQPTAQIIHVDCKPHEGTPDGSSQHPFATIQLGADLAQPGDTVMIHAGVYREWVRPARSGRPDAPITYQGAPGEIACIKGSDPWLPKGGWKPAPEHADVYTGAIDDAMFPIPPGVPGPAYINSNNPYKVGIATRILADNLNVRPTENADHLPLTLGALFVDGRQLNQRERLADILATPGTWITNAQGDALTVHFPNSKKPSESLIEIETRARLFAPVHRSLSYITVRALTFEHCANPAGFPQYGAVSTRSGSHWIIENNIIRFASSTGLDIGSEAYDPKGLAQTLPEDQVLKFASDILVRNNTLSDNDIAGISGWNSARARITGNIITRNCLRKYMMLSNGKDIQWMEQAGIKLHLADAHLDGNVVFDNGSYGIWIDHKYHDARLNRNLIYGNSESGIFVEIGTGPITIDHNIIVENHNHGVYSHDASGIVVANNLIMKNTGFGVWMHVMTDRKLKDAAGVDQFAQCSNNRVVSNLILDNHEGAVSLPPDSTLSHDNQSDNNLYGVSKPGAERLFRLNNNTGRIKTKPEDKGLKSAQIMPELVDILGQNIAIDPWRKISGRDANSIICEKVSDQFDRQHRMLVLKIDLKPMPAFTSALSASPTIPGPFEKLPDGLVNVTPAEITPVEVTPIAKP